MEEVRLVVASFQCECEHASAKVLALNWLHSLGICVQFIRSRDLFEIFTNVSPVFRKLRINYFHINYINEREQIIPKQCVFESRFMKVTHNSRSSESDISRMSAEMRFLLKHVNFHTLHLVRFLIMNDFCKFRIYLNTRFIFWESIFFIIIANK